MAYIVIFLFISLAWTLSVGIGISTSPNEKCIISISSQYYSESQYCLSSSNQKKINPAVCDEIFTLFDEICSYSTSSTAVPLPEPHDVSKDNCVLLCADLDMRYVSLMMDNSSYSCTSLCFMDRKAVAVFSTVFQLKDFLAELKQKEKESVATVTNSEQSKSSLEAVDNASAPIEPNAKPTTAAVVNASVSQEPNAKPTTAELNAKKELVVTASSSTSEVATAKKPTQNVEPSTTGKSSVPSTKPDFKTTTTASMRPSSTKATEKSTTATETIVKKTTLQEKPAITAEGENDTTPKEPETTLTPVITVATEKKPTQNVEPSTTDKERKRVSSTKQVVKPTTAAQEEDPLDKTDNSDADFFNVNESEDIKEDDDGLNKDDEPVPDDTPSKIEEKDETSRQDDTPSSYHFLIYFLAFIVMCVAAYIVFHNKHKIIAFIIEGKQGRRGGRPSTKQYTPLKSKVEDVMPFIEKSTTQSNYIY